MHCPLLPIHRPNRGVDRLQPHPQPNVLDSVVIHVHRRRSWRNLACFLFFFWSAWFLNIMLIIIFACVFFRYRHAAFGCNSCRVHFWDCMSKDICIYILIPLVRRLALAFQPHLHSSHKHWHCRRLIDWAELITCRRIYKPCRIDWLIDWLNFARGDTNVGTVHRLIDWLSPWGHGICSSVDWNDASALFYAMQSEQTVKPEKGDFVFFTPNIPKTWYMYPYRAQYLTENCIRARGGTRAKFTSDNTFHEEQHWKWSRFLCFCTAEKKIGNIFKNWKFSLLKSLLERNFSQFF